MDKSFILKLAKPLRWVAIGIEQNCETKHNSNEFKLAVRTRTPF